MKRIQSQWTWMSGLVLLTAMTAGCQSDQLIKERDALFAQNNALQQRLNDSRAAYDATLAENERLSAQLAQRSEDARTGSEGAAAGGGGFNEIEGVDTFTDRGRITIRIPGDVLFASGKISLKTSSRKTLGRIAAVIKSEHPSSMIRVLGYTDTDPIRKSKWVDNLQLSQERAAAVHRYLQNQGIAPENLEAVGKGPWDPRKTKTLSRRVEIVVVAR
jgi:chemotaxis protein MotB